MTVLAYRERPASGPALAAFHDGLWEATGLTPAQTVLGGFSMGAVMSYALGLDSARPAPAGIIALSGFVPTVAGWEPSLAASSSPADRRGMRAFVAHGRRDPVIDVEFARRAVLLLRSGGLDVSYHESNLAHQIDPGHIGPAADWLTATRGVAAGP